MLKRLLVLVAALAALFVFASSASAQQATQLPEDCRGALTNPTDLADCLRDLQAAGGLEVPDECTRFLTTPPTLLDFTGGPGGNPVASLLLCLNAITGLGDDDIGQPFEGGGEGYDLGYGYDYGYDIGYDEGVPEGGVDSGFGPTGSDAAGAPLAARGAALLAVLGVLTTGLVIMRRRHGS